MAPEQFITHLSKIVREHRKRAGLSQEQLAAHAGVGKTVVFDIEHGKASVRLNTLIRILDILNIELNPSSPFLKGEGK